MSHDASKQLTATRRLGTEGQLIETAEMLAEAARLHEQLREAELTETPDPKQSEDDMHTSKAALDADLPDGGDVEEGVLKDELNSDADESAKSPASKEEAGISENPCDHPACQIIQAHGISRRFTPTKLAEHKARSHPPGESAKEAARTARLASMYKRMFLEKAMEMEK